MKGEFAEARDMIDAQLKTERANHIRSSLFTVRAAIDAQLQDLPAYRTDAAEAAKHSNLPELLLPQLIVHASGFDQQTAIDLVDQLVQAHQKLEGGLDEKMVWWLMQRLYQSGHRKVYDELVLELASISYGSILSKDHLHREAAEILGARGDVAKALEHALHIRGRDEFIDLLTDRRYEPLWVELERNAGDKLEKLGREQLIATKAEFQARPDELDVRMGLMRAYVDLGMFDEADKLGREVGSSRDELLALTAATAYVVDMHADILHQTEGIDAADRRRAALVDTWTPERSWVINMAINRIARLFAAHRYEKALSLLDEQKWQLEGFSSPYARQLLRALRLGSLVGLSRRPEAQAIVPQILKHADDAPAATLGSLLLAEADDQAELLAIKWLEDPRQRTIVLKFLRIDDFSRVDDPVAHQVAARLRARPKVAAAFATYGRDLPERLRRAF